MAELITTLAAVDITCVVTSGSTISGRGYRCSIQSDGTFNAAGIGELGQVFSQEPSDSGNGQFLGARTSASGSVPALSSIATSTGDVAYTAASGLSSNVATSAVRIGIWSQGAPASSTLGIIQPD